MQAQQGSRGIAPLIHKGKNTHTAERQAACDIIRGNKAVDLFARIKSQAAGRSAPRRPAPLRCMCVFTPTTALDVGGRSTRRHNHFNRREINPVLIAKEAMWASRPVWRGTENLTPPRFEPRTVHAVPSRYADYVIPVAQHRTIFVSLPLILRYTKKHRKVSSLPMLRFLTWH